MPEYLCQVRWPYVSNLPRDVMTTNLYFNDRGVTTDPDQLAMDIAEVFDNVWNKFSQELEVRLYDRADSKPRPVKGQALIHSGTRPVAGMPREVALCLSYFADRNLPRNRGRMYLPVSQYQTSTSLGERPGTNIMGAALAMVTLSNQSFPDVGGVDVQWCVYSRADDKFKQVTDAWVDDEWDTVRSRGLKATRRDTAHREG
jgi:hypothetical protein